jgi:hypothetical protein
MAYRIERVLYSGTDVAAGTYNGPATDAWDFDQNRFIAVLTATRKSGAGALDAKLQVSGDRGTTWVDYPSGAFTQITAGTGTQAMKIDPAGALLRAVVTVGATTTFDISLTASGRGD